MSQAPKRPRILIEISGGNLQNIVVDGDVEIVTIDYDNAKAENEDGTLTRDWIEETLSPSPTSGSAAEFDQAISGHRDSLCDIGGIDIDIDDEDEPTSPAP